MNAAPPDGLLRNKLAALPDYGAHSQALVDRVIAEVAPYTMVKPEGLECTIRLTLSAINAGVPGALVECGTWRGGSSFAMLLAQRYAFGEIKRPVWMFDSFQGMPDPSERDGEHGRWWRARSLSGVEDPKNQNFCIASLDQVREAIARLDLAKHTIVRAGWFHETIPQGKPQQIAVLRVDCDWYDPCMCVYRELEPLVSVGAPIIIDDYYSWEGCRLATHEYLTDYALPWRIRSAPDFACAWMIKEKEAW